MPWLSFHMRCKGRGEVLGGNMRGIREIYVIDSSAGVSLTSDGGVVIAQLDLAVVEHSSEVAVT